MHTRDFRTRHSTHTSNAYSRESKNSNLNFNNPPDRTKLLEVENTIYHLKFKIVTVQQTLLALLALIPYAGFPI